MNRWCRFLPFEAYMSMPQYSGSPEAAARYRIAGNIARSYQVGRLSFSLARGGCASLQKGGRGTRDWASWLTVR